MNCNDFGGLLILIFTLAAYVDPQAWQHAAHCKYLEDVSKKQWILRMVSLLAEAVTMVRS